MTISVDPHAIGSGLVTWAALSTLLGVAVGVAVLVLAAPRFAAAGAAAGAPGVLSFAVESDDEAAVEHALEAASAALQGKNRRGRALGAICRGYLEARDA